MIPDWEKPTEKNWVSDQTCPPAAVPCPPQRGREEAELITLDDDDDGPAFVNANPVITQDPVAADPTEEELGELILSW